MKTPPVNCEKGYSGNLCHLCTKAANGDIYERSGKHKCSKCIDTATNILRITGLLILVLVGIAVLIWFNIQRKGESESATLMRIMTNYLQIISSTISFNL